MCKRTSFFFLCESVPESDLDTGDLELLLRELELFDDPNELARLRPLLVWEPFLSFPDSIDTWKLGRCFSRAFRA